MALHISLAQSQVSGQVATRSQSLLLYSGNAPTTLPKHLRSSRFHKATHQAPRVKHPVVHHQAYRPLLCRGSLEVVAAPEEEVLVGEDYHKAGGTEVGFVKLQSAKDAEGQDDLSARLGRLQVEDGGLLDVAVVGCGPAGLSLAAELASHGLRVGLIGRSTPFVNTYGVWPDEFEKLGFESCINHIWEDTILYTDSNEPIQTGRPYARVDRNLLREELIARCKKWGVLHLNVDVASIDEDKHLNKSTLVTTTGLEIQTRLAVVAAGAASGKFLQYEKGTRGVGVQTAYGIEVEMESPYPYPPKSMLFMDYRDLPPASEATKKSEGSFYPLPTFVYAMPSSPTRVFFEETCLAARPAMPFSILKERLHRRLEGLGVKYSTVFEEEWSYIPVGGDLPDTTQPTLGFGAAACLVHPATGYSLTRSLSEAPGYAAAIASALRGSSSSNTGESVSAAVAANQAWTYLWSQERKRQRAFMIFGLELILQMDTSTTRDFFTTFFKLPPWLWRGFLASSLSSVDLILFAAVTFVIAPNSLRFCLVKHLVTDPSGASLVKMYLGQNAHK